MYNKDNIIGLQFKVAKTIYIVLEPGIYEHTCPGCGRVQKNNY